MIGLFAMFGVCLGIQTTTHREGDIRMGHEASLRKVLKSMRAVAHSHNDSLKAQGVRRASGCTESEVTRGLQMGILVSAMRYGPQVFELYIRGSDVDRSDHLHIVLQLWRGERQSTTIIAHGSHHDFLPHRHVAIA